MRLPGGDKSGAGAGPEDSLPLGAVAVGGYVLEVGSPAGTAVRPAGSEAAEARELADALEGRKLEREPQRTAATAAADLVDDASEMTAKVERALALGEGVAAGKALDPEQLSLEVDTLLGLLEQLDREGRHKDALRLARALSNLLTLLRRWAALLQALRAALHAGEELGDLRGIAWAKHELGTLQLAAGDAEGARQSLDEARDLREQLGDGSELGATEGNLQVLSERPQGTLLPEVEPVNPNPPTIARLLPAIAAGVLIFGVGLAGGAVVGGSGDDGVNVATATDTLTTTTTEPLTDTETVTETETETVTETEIITVEEPSVE